ncbi:APC family permease [Maridesulfovibrio frigidus]|uniref:APC family permease n=1 Tax=Maridesulfovibrio frigidus TaxID=340956 RepID=UPI0004E107B7|nr:APC family permease [Maridesulfovibrio frigidus]
MAKEVKSGSKETVGFVSAVSIGIGGMVGGAIFAVLGLSAGLARGSMPIAFLVGGIVALSTSYSYAKLSVAFPSRGGTVSFINRAFGHGLFSGSLNNLLLLSYVVVLSLYAYAFGGYGASFFPVEDQKFAQHILLSGALIGLTVLNITAAEKVLKTENLINALKMIILFMFVGAAFYTGINYEAMSPPTWVPPLEMIAGAMIIFVNYEGFELISNAAPDVPNRAKILPAAHYTSVIVVVALYILIAVACLGVMSPEELQSFSDYALAAAARKVCGATGFTMIAVAALLATASAINATFYCASRITYTMAEEDEAPHFLENMFMGQPVLGLILISTCTLFIANLVDLRAISTMASSGFLLVFAAVNAANIKLAEKTGSSKIISGIAFLLCIGALVSICLQVWSDPVNRHHLWVLAGMFGISCGLEVIYRFFTSRRKVCDVS